MVLASLDGNDRHAGFDRIGNKTILMRRVVHLLEFFRARSSISAPCDLRTQLDPRDGHLALGIFLNMAYRLVLVGPQPFMRLLSVVSVGA